jgi:hypothetical protein
MTSLKDDLYFLSFSFDICLFQGSILLTDMQFTAWLCILTTNNKCLLQKDWITVVMFNIKGEIGDAKIVKSLIW